MNHTLCVGSLFSSGVHVHLIERRVHLRVADHAKRDVVHERVGRFAVVLELFGAALREVADEDWNAASHLRIDFGLGGDHDEIGVESLFDEESDFASVNRSKEIATLLSIHHRRNEESPFRNSRTLDSCQCGRHEPPRESSDDQSDC